MKGAPAAHLGAALLSAALLSAALAAAPARAERPGALPTMPGALPPIPGQEEPPVLPPPPARPPSASVDGAPAAASSSPAGAAAASASSKAAPSPGPADPTAADAKADPAAPGASAAPLKERRRRPRRSGAASGEGAAAGAAGEAGKVAPGLAGIAGVQVIIPHADEAGSDFAVTAAVEHLAVAAALAPISVRVSPLEREVVLSSPRGAKALLADVSRRISRLCPRSELRFGEVVLHCATRRLDAVAIDNGRVVELRELRGLPWRVGQEQVLPTAPYAPMALQEGEACAGAGPQRPAASAECALRAGNRAVAAAFFARAGPAEARPHAELRLGDLALEAGDVVEALNHYDRAGQIGPFGRMALAHICEITGSCLEINGIFDAAGLPEPMRSELELREARLKVFLGKESQAARLMVPRLLREDRPPLCPPALMPVCQHVALAVLRNPREEPQVALQLFLALPRDGRDPQTAALTVEVTSAAAELALRMGAPQFGANILAEATPGVPPERLESHLLRTAELYRLAGDKVRLAVIAEFTRSRFGDKATASVGWAQALSELPARTPQRAARKETEAKAAEAVEADVDAALAAAKKASARASELEQR